MEGLTEQGENPSLQAAACFMRGKMLAISTAEMG
jgi:hypothetical protein